MAVNESAQSEQRTFRVIILAGVLSWVVWLILMRMSAQFAWESAPTERPLLAVLGVLGLLFGLYAGVASVVLRDAPERRNLTAIVIFSVAFRLLTLFSEPIQEVDAYRYIWDGKVVAAGVNPFRYSPEQVRNAQENKPLAADLRRLIRVRDRSATNAEILSRVHYAELTTVYPPVSQIVFGGVALLTPHAWSVSSQLLMMKVAMVVFDLATLVLVIRLLRFTGRPQEWSILYGWCPLIVKEFANSGHLDAITVFLTTASVVCALHAFFPACGRRERTAWLWWCSLLVVAAVGAKIYPVVLFPMMFLGACRVFGFVRASFVATVTLSLCVLMIVPMLIRDDPVQATATAADFDDASAASEVETQTGLTAFASQWQMNDFLFLLLYENLRPDVLPNQLTDSALPQIENARPAVWFVVTSGDWRRWFAKRASVVLGVPARRVPFLATRLITSLIFLGVALSLVVRCGRQWNRESWLEAVFLTLAWFWMLQPTQNPWYWTWAMPFVPFVRSRVWIAVSGVVLIYYLRFWLIYHVPDTPVAKTAYAGENFYDFCVVWMEYAPFLCCLAISSRRG